MRRSALALGSGLVMIVGLVLASAMPAQAAVNLKHRTEGSAIHAVSGSYSAPCAGCIGGKYLMFSRGQNVTIQGQGYFWLRWEIEYWRGCGVIAMPSWTGKSGTLIHVASGGGHRMDDQVPGQPAGTTWFGKTGGCYSSLPSGTPMIWQNEFYYLDGTVTITNNEKTNGQNGMYNIAVNPQTYNNVYTDINTKGVRYGVSYDQ